MTAAFWENGQLTNLGTLGGETSRAYGINNIGQIVGRSETSDGDYHAFIYQDGAMTDIDIGGNYSSAGNSINDSGQIAGFFRLNQDAETHAAVWSNGEVIDLGTLGGSKSWAYDINNSGQVTGTSYPVGDPSFSTRAFLSAYGVMTDLGALGDQRTSVSYGGLNDSGQVVGWSDTDDGVHAFIWEDGVMTDLGEYLNTAKAINDAGQIVGLKVIDGAGHAFMLEDGILTDMGLGGRSSKAIGINNSGQIIGSAYPDIGSQYTYVWDNGVITDLGEFWLSDINDAGQIVGMYDFSIEPPPPPEPIPAPGALLLGGIGVACVNWLRRRRTL